MRQKLGTVCMVIGGVLILAALSLFLWNRREDALAEQSVAQALPQLLEQVELRSDSVSPDEAPTLPDPYDPTMTEVEIDGYAYIGYLSVPSLSLDLPILSQWDYTRLKIAPCRYAGSTKTDDLVLAGHNYTRHFGPLHRIQEGDTVYFTDMDGIVTQYEVVLLETLAPSDVDTMTAGDYDLTLFTCTLGGQSRVTVRCEQVENS